jgi:hypothetical protein
MSDEYVGWSIVSIKFLDMKIPDSELILISGIFMSLSEDNTDEVFDHKNIVHFEYLEYSQTVYQQCFFEILIR